LLNYLCIYVDAGQVNATNSLNISHIIFNRYIFGLKTAKYINQRNF